MKGEKVELKMKDDNRQECLNYTSTGGRLAEQEQTDGATVVIFDEF